MRSCVAKKPEILAPAGNMESLRLAVNHGADAVYLGMRSFSARAKAENFDEEGLREAIRYAHFYNVRIYLAVNTLFLPQEKEEALKQIEIAHKLGVDAIILQDLTLLSEIKHTMPDIIVHLSTQCGIHNLYGARVAKKLGADRIILSRECTIEDIKEIINGCDIEVECFVQGALCVSFSGNCYFSSLVSGYSGNRGKCLQLCRKKYSINGRDGYWLSPKDLCLADKVDELAKLGVASLKIEGRMRRPEYVGAAVDLYRKVVDGKPYNLDDIKVMYNRGDYTIGHIKNPTEKVIFSEVQGHIGLKVGTVNEIINKKAVLSRSFSKGDAVKFLRNNREIGTAKLYSDGNSTTFLGNVKAGDEVRLTTHAETVNRISAKTRFVGVDCFVVISCNNKIKVDIKNDRVKATYYSDFIADSATKVPISDDNIKDIFAKCRDYGFELRNFKAINDGRSFVAKSVFNEFRRSCFSDFYEKHCNSYKKPQLINDSCDFSLLDKVDIVSENAAKIFVQTDKIEKIEMLSRVADMVAYSPRDYEEFYQNIDKFPQNVYLNTPQIARGNDIKLLEKIANNEKIQNVIANNIYALELFKDKNIILGPFFNIIDDAEYPNKILSVEGGVSQNSFTYAYGYFPFMTLTHCVKKTVNNGSCANCEKYDYFVSHDENGNEFRYARFAVSHCYAHLLNKKPIDLSPINAKKPINKVFIDFSYDESGEEEHVIKCFRQGLDINRDGIFAFANKELE